MENTESTYFLRAHFSGRVQGVGFRYSTSQVAKGFDVTGYVKNLVDGRVEVEIEGDEGECLGFLDALEDEMDSYIKKVERSTGNRLKQFDRFRIA